MKAVGCFALLMLALARVDGTRRTMDTHLTAGNDWCVSDHPCGYHGYTYKWCITNADGDWDYCCADECSNSGCSPGGGYDQQFCSPPTTETVGGVACRSNHLCGYHGNSYVWCYIDYYDNWQYCAHDPNDNLNNIIDSEVDNVREEVSSDLSQITRRLEVLESRLLETNPREPFSPDVTIIIANLAPVSAHETESALNLAPVGADETETALNLAPVGANETETVLNLAPAGANETETTHNLAPVGGNETETTHNLAPVGANETETTLNLAPVGAKETETTLNLTPVGAKETETALMDKIRQILAEGLALPHIEPVAVTRLAVRGRGPGLVLLELRDVEDKITVMNAKQSLKNKDEYKNLDLRAAEGHTDRLMRLNFNTLLSHLNRRREFWFTVSGRLVPREHGSSVEPAGRAVGGDITIVASEPADA